MARYIEEFRCEIVTGRDHVVVAPSGELDMSTIGAVEQELRRQQEAGVRKLVLDLRGLSFMDSTGLHLVSRWSEAAARDGFEFEVVPGSPVVQRVFELAEMTDSLPFRKPE